jgi:peptidoglycan-associated lipoprotein
VKESRIWLIGAIIFPLVLSFGCSKKTIRSEALGTPSTAYEPRPTEVKPETKPEARLEPVSPDRDAAEREKRLKEEALREEALREKALREEAAKREAALKAAKLEAIYFEFDQWTIREDQKEVMAKNSEWLKANPNVKVRLEGHCDERGTTEYNLALGQKRADSAKTFLEGLGVPGQRIATISYGEERPLDPAHNEAAWAKNRRVDIVPLQ